MPTSDNAEPRRPKFLSDNDDPMCVKSSTDTAEPTRAKLLKDKLDPTCA
jgi:hypothetical protein